MRRNKTPDYGPDWRSSGPSAPVRPGLLSWLVWRWSPTLMWVAIAFWATSVAEWGSTFGDGTDKVGHFIAYVIMALLIHRSLCMGQKRPRLGPNAVLVIITSMLVGLSGELHQRSIPGREFQSSDLAANFTGAMIALMLLLPWYKRSKLRSFVGTPLDER